MTRIALLTTVLLACTAPRDEPAAPPAVSTPAAAPAPAPPPPIWGELTPGPHAVGFRQIEKYDHARLYRLPTDLDGRPRAGEIARPMRISLWYPARATAANRLRYADYIALMGAEDALGPVTEADRREGEALFFGFPIASSLDAEQRQALLSLDTMAVAEAPPATGQFPVILYSPGSAAIGHVLPEYLASHGYLVAQLPRLGTFAGMIAEVPDRGEYETKVADLGFVLNALAELPSADVDRIGVTGFSAGGRWAVGQAMRHRGIDAVVSLDSSLLEPGRDLDAWKQMLAFDLAGVRAPVLHLVRRELADREDLALWDGMKHAARTRIVFEDDGIDHLDFQSIGLALLLAGARTEHADTIRRTFHETHRRTLAFLDAHLLGGEAAPGASTPHLAITHAAAAPAPLTFVDLANALDEGNTAAAIAAYRRHWQASGAPPLAEQQVNLAGYLLLFRQRTDDAIALFELNVEAYPRSANARDSLADAYLAAGRKAEALAATRAAEELLAVEPDLAPDRRKAIADSIAGKLKQLQ